MGASATPPVKPRGRRLRRLLLWFLACYLGVIVVLLWLENSFIYHPCPAAVDWRPAPAGSEVEEVWLPGSDGGKIHAWWFPRQGSTGALLYCHGNAGNLSHRGPAIPELMRTLGESVLIFDYPGYGKSDGKPSEAGCYAAGEAAYRWLTETKHIPGERVILFGKSLGGGVATELSIKHPYRALVLIKAFTSVPDMAQRQFPFLPARWLVRNKFDNLAKLRQLRGPVAVASGDRDELMPWWMGQALYEAAPEPKQFFPLAGSGHNDPFPPTFLGELAAFLAKAAPLPATVPD